MEKISKFYASEILLTGCRTKSDRLLESVIDSASALTESLSYITNSKVRGTLKTTAKVTNYPVFLMDDNGNINGYRSIVSNQLPSNLTKGEGSNLSALIFGNFTDVIIGMWGYMDIKVDPYSLSTSGSIRVIVLQDIDTNVRHIESFSALKDLVYPKRSSFRK